MRVQLTYLLKNLADSDGEELGADDIVKKSTGFPKLGALKEEEEDQVLRGSNLFNYLFTNSFLSWLTQEMVHVMSFSHCLKWHSNVTLNRYDTSHSRLLIESSETFDINHSNHHPVIRIQLNGHHSAFWFIPRFNWSKLAIADYFYWTIRNSFTYFWHKIVSCECFRRFARTSNNNRPNCT